MDKTETLKVRDDLFRAKSGLFFWSKIDPTPREILSFTPRKKKCTKFSPNFDIFLPTFCAGIRGAKPRKHKNKKVHTEKKMPKNGHF